MKEGLQYRFTNFTACSTCFAPYIEDEEDPTVLKGNCDHVDPILRFHKNK